jgi:hypothetical protein
MKKKQNKKPSQEKHQKRRRIRLTFSTKHKNVQTSDLSV